MSFDSTEKYEYAYPGDSGFPAFIKPKDGGSSIDAYKVTNADDLQTYAHKIKDYIIQPFISGREYTIDIFCDYEGNPVYITPRERLAVRAGEVLKTQICQDRQMISEMKTLIADYRPCGQITVRLIREEESGDDYYIEINPRFGGGAPLSIKAGADSAEAVIRVLKGDKLSYKEDAAVDGAVYCRFDQSICVSEGSNNEMTEITDILDVENYIGDLDAIIFDLDDTLYSEKEYVRSGYRKIAELFPEIKGAEELLWKFFQEKKSALDEFLKCEDIFTEANKAKCLEVYRFHKPDIHLYSGVREMLKRLKRNYKLGMITDGRPEGQRAKIKALGLEEIFDQIIITDELGGTEYRKPNETAYRMMAKKFGTEFGAMCYVGDNTKKDFIAPMKLGMKSIWFRNEDGLYQCSEKRRGVV